MKRTGSGCSAFVLLSKGSLLFISVFFLTALYCILEKGIPYFGELLHSRELQFAFGLSMKTSVLSTAFCLLLGIPAAYALSEGKHGIYGLAGAAVGLLLSIPNMVLGLSLLMIFSSAPGKFLSSQGIRLIFDTKGIVIAQILVNLPLVLRMLRSSFEAVDPYMKAAAKSMGAEPSQIFLYILLPLSRRTILSAALLAWSKGIGEFGATLMLVGATRMKTETIPTSIFLNMATGEIGPAMACAVLLLLISAAVQLANGMLDRKIKKEELET